MGAGRMGANAINAAAFFRAEWARRNILALLFLLPLLTACRTGTNNTDERFALASGDVWIRDVTVVSPGSPNPLPHAHVVVRQGHIARVAVGSPGLAASGVTMIDGTGRYLVP